MASKSITVTLPEEIVAAIQSRVAEGEFASENECIEFFLRADLVPSVTPQPGLEAWVNTEGVRRLQALEKNPELALSHEEFWTRVEADIASEDATNNSRDAA